MNRTNNHHLPPPPLPHSSLQETQYQLFNDNIDFRFNNNQYLPPVPPLTLPPLHHHRRSFSSSATMRYMPVHNFQPSTLSSTQDLNPSRDTLHYPHANQIPALHSNSYHAPTLQQPQVASNSLYNYDPAPWQAWVPSGIQQPTPPPPLVHPPPSPTLLSYYPSALQSQESPFRHLQSLSVIPQRQHGSWYAGNGVCGYIYPAVPSDYFYVPESVQPSLGTHQQQQQQQMAAAIQQQAQAQAVAQAQYTAQYPPQYGVGVTANGQYVPLQYEYLNPIIQHEHASAAPGVLVSDEEELVLPSLMIPPPHHQFLQQPQAYSADRPIQLGRYHYPIPADTTQMMMHQQQQQLQFQEHQQQNQHQQHPHLLQQLSHSQAQTQGSLQTRKSRHLHNLSNLPLLPFPSNATLPALPAPTPHVLSPLSLSLPPTHPIFTLSPQSSAWRDAALTHSHTMYTSNSRSSLLLPLLTQIHHHHPTHLPTLLLLACAHYSLGNSELSLLYNQRILEFDSTYVEAMSNIGTTLRGLGKVDRAEMWWREAVRLRPGYWDAVENLIGLLCATSPETTPSSSSSSSISSSVTNLTKTSTISSSTADPAPLADSSQILPRYKEALEVCIFVETHVLGKLAPMCVTKYADNPAVVGTLSVNKDGLANARVTTEKLPAHLAAARKLPPHHLPRLQNLLYAMGNLRSALGDNQGAHRDYERAAEIMFGGRTLQEVVDNTTRYAATLGTGHYTDKISIAKALDAVLMTPESVTTLWEILFGIPASQMLLAAHSNVSAQYFTISPNGASESDAAAVNQSAAQNAAAALALANQAQTTTSTVLLTLAKFYQDTYVPVPLRTLLPLHYLALAVHPSPATCNNLGILLASLPAPNLASQFYAHGLTLDPRHPHLYTNLGSLLKDVGNPAEAIRMYEKAVECDPKFDVALANLGNAVKDMGRVQESVNWYRRAVEVNPDFNEAVCGLVNAMNGICDWRNRGIGALPVSRIDDNNNNEEATSREEDEPLPVFLADPDQCLPFVMKWLSKEVPVLEKEESESSGSVVATRRKCWMDRVVQIVEQHLTEGLTWGRNAVNEAMRMSFVTDVVSILDSLASTREEARRVRRWVFLLGEGLRKADDTAKRKDEIRDEGILNILDDVIPGVGVRNPGGWILRVAERAAKYIQWKWYTERWNPNKMRHLKDPNRFRRPALPTLSTPPIPTVLPFHSFTYPFTPRQIRLISHRNALRISHATLSASWLPRTVYPPPPPPSPHLHIGYLSSDFANHPLSHLMQSVFGMHDPATTRIFCYALTPNDGSPYRAKIMSETHCFKDVSTLTVEAICAQIVADGIHVLVNLNGYTKGARNEIFAARPAPVLAAFMGFAGTLGGSWCDWMVSDDVVCPPLVIGPCRASESDDLLPLPRSSSARDQQPPYPKYRRTLSEGPDPESDTESWVYAERMIYMPHSYFVNDHRQGFRDDDGIGAEILSTPPPPLPPPAASAAADVVAESSSPSRVRTRSVNFAEEGRRWIVSEDYSKSSSWRNHDPIERFWMAEESRRMQMRREVFPGLREDVVIFANFNQLYKIDPAIFLVWLRILHRVPNSILWLLKFPAAGEEHLRRTASEWAGPEVASRVVFTDVAPKHIHITRGRVADLFLDTPECNAHTTAADILWSGTPILTHARHLHKMCSRVAASVARASGGDAYRHMIVSSELEYENRAVSLAQSLIHITESNSISPRPPPPPVLIGPGPRITRIEGPLADLRKSLFLRRERSRLFDTKRWTRNLEKGFREAWSRWVRGWDWGDEDAGILEFECPDECIWVSDDEDGTSRERYRAMRWAPKLPGVETKGWFNGLIEKDIY